MVYCGRPSLACENCRTRRIKCDQKRPGCTQCKHTKRQCLGYRNPNDVLFRDESKKVMAKFDHQPPPSLDSPKQAMVKTTGLEQRQSSADTADPFHIASFQPRIEDVAVTFLLSDYVRSSHFRYLPRFYASNSSHGALQPVVKAVALAALAQHSGRHELQAQARKYHVDAVATLKTFLECPEAAIADEVMATVLLLSLYETVTMQKMATAEAWEMHIRGALTLLTMRGSKRFISEYGVELFTQTSKIIKMFYLQNRLRLPEVILRLTEEAKSYVQPGAKMMLDYAHLVDGFTDLVADMKHGDLTNPYEIISRADGLLQVMNVAEPHFPCFDQYNRISARSRDSKPRNQKRELDREPFTAQAWHNLWMARLELNVMVCKEYSNIQELCGEDPAEDPGLLLEAMEHCQNAVEAAEDIYASVQQFFPDDIPTMATHTPEIAAGYFSIWPLFTAGACPSIDAHFRNKIIVKLDYIAAVMNLPQAHKAAEMLQSGCCAEDFMHIYHVF